MVRPSQSDLNNAYDMSRTRSQGVARAEEAGTQGFGGVPPGDESKTENQKREEERRGFKVPGFFGTALEWFEKIDKPISERLGWEIPEMRGPLDEAGRFLLEEATRPSNLLIATGGVGVAGRLGATAARAGAAAAGRTGASKVGLKGVQGAFKGAQFLTEPVVGARGIALPTRIAGETAAVAGFRGASEKMSEAIPETAPGIFKIGAPLAVGLLGGIAGARAFTGAAKGLGINIANEKGMKALGESVVGQERKYIDSAVRTKESGELDFDVPTAKRARADELGRIIGTAESGDSVLRTAHIHKAAEQAKNQQEIFDMAREIDSGKYTDANGVKRAWGDVPDFMGGRESAQKYQWKFEAKRQAANNWVAAEMVTLRQVMRDATVDGIKLEDAIDFNTGDWKEIARPYLRVNDDGSMSLTEKAKAWDDASDQLIKTLDTVHELEKSWGIGTREITGESLEDVPEEVWTDLKSAFDNDGVMPKYTDFIERRAGKQHYFTRFVTGGQDAKLRGGKNSFGGAFFEKHRRPGFSEGAEYQRLMFENAEAMGADPNNPLSYLGDPLAAIELRIQAGLNRITAEWFKEAVNKFTPGLGGRTLIERMEQEPTWGASRRKWLQAGATLRKAVGNVKRLERKAKENGRRAKGLNSSDSTFDATSPYRAGEYQNAQDVTLDLDTMIRDLELASEGASLWATARARKAIDDMRESKEKLSKLSADTDLEQLSVDVDNATTQWIDADKELGDLLKNPTRRAKFEADTGANAAERMQQRITWGNTQRNLIARRRMDGIVQDIGSKNRPNPEANQRLRSLGLDQDEIDETLAQLELAGDFYASSSRDYEYASQQAGTTGKDRTVFKDRATGQDVPAMASGEVGRIDNFAMGGRYFDGEFADEMNKFMTQADQQGLGGFVSTFNNFTRPLMATMDLSSMGIQGLLSAGVDPLGSARMMGMTFLSLFNPRVYEGWVVKNRGAIDNFIKDGGYYAGLDDVGEFIFPGGITKIPIFGPAAKVANHHFSRTGNALRIMLYKNALKNTNVIQSALGRGALKNATGLGDRENIVETINESTGFKSQRPGDLTSALFFAPRFFTSQLDLLGKAATKPGKEGAVARDMLLRTMGAAALATLWINDMAGEETETNFIRYDAEGKPHWNSNAWRVRVGGQDVSLLGSWDSLAGLFGTLVTEGPSSGAMRVLRTKGSPALSTLFDVVTEETFRGNPVNLRSGDPRDTGLAVLNLMQQKLPFTLQEAISEFSDDPNFSVTDVDSYNNPLGLGLISNAVGLKATPMTSYEMRDVRARQDFDGKDYKLLTPKQKAELQAEYPEVFERIDARTEERALRGDMGAEAQMEKKRLAAQLFEAERALALGVENGDIARSDFAKYFQQMQKNHAIQKRQIDQMHGLDYVESTEPNLQALNAWFELYDEPNVKLLGGVDMNWDLLDDLQASLRTTFTAEQNAFLDDYLETNYSKHPPEIHDFIRLKEIVNKSGYWSVADEATKTFTERIKAATGLDVSNYGALEKAIRTTGNRRNKIYLERVLKAIDRLKSAQRDRLRSRNPELDVALVYTRGYTPKTREGRAALGTQ